MLAERADEEGAAEQACRCGSHKYESAVICPIALGRLPVSELLCAALQCEEEVIAGLERGARIKMQGAARQAGRCGSHSVWSAVSCPSSLGIRPARPLPPMCLQGHTRKGAGELAREEIAEARA